MRVGIGIRPIVSSLKKVEDLEEFLEAIFVEMADFKDIEVHSDNLDNFEIILLKLAKRSGFRFSIHCIHMCMKHKINFCSAVSKDIKNADAELKKSIEYAKKLNAKYIILHPDIPKKCSKKKALEILEQHLKTNMKLLNKNQKILIENMPGEEYALSTPEEFKIFLKIIT